jgi:hypothetical protein
MTDPEVGFVSMAGPRASGEAPVIGVGILGYAFMGKAHTNAYKTLPYMMYPPAAIPRSSPSPGATSRPSKGQRDGTVTSTTIPTGTRC